MQKLDLMSVKFIPENIQRLGEIFPGCIIESTDANGLIDKKVDFDLLRQELSEFLVEGAHERYQLNWPGKKEALLVANASIDKALRPCIGDSINFETTKNIFIEGDNLDVLKLLQESYLGKIRLIYIDPPYNTGSDLIYEDCFASSLDEFLKFSNQVDNSGNRLIANSESNGRFHSDWLSMMYSRLRLARNLLSDDGVIMISIGNDEVTNLRKLCDEVYGEDNFIECITWNKRVPKNDKGVGSIHEYILVYVKNNLIPHEFRMRKDGLEEIEELLIKLKKAKTPIAEAEAELKKLYKKQGYDRGITLYNSLDANYRLWGKINMSWPNSNTFGPNYEVLHPLTGKPVASPDRGWRWKRDTFYEAALYKNGQYTDIKKLVDGSCICGKIWFSSDPKIQPSSVTYLDDVNYFLLRSILSFKSDGGIEVEALFDGKSYFSYPKPTSLLKALIGSVKLNDNDIVMDFFAGSGTTAEVVLSLNAEDSIRRQFIVVQIPEACDSDSEAFKAGYSNLAQLSRERIRRAAQKIETDSGLMAKGLDLGFRAIKIDSSNLTKTHLPPDELHPDLLSSHVDNVVKDRSGDDLLFQVLLAWGVDLSLPVQKEMVLGNEIYKVDGNALIACFDSVGGVDDVLVKQIAEAQPLRVVFRDSGFKDDAMKINVEQIFRSLSPHTEVKTI